MLNPFYAFCMATCHELLLLNLLQRKCCVNKDHEDGQCIKEILQKICNWVPNYSPTYPRSYSISCLNTCKCEAGNSFKDYYRVSDESEWPCKQETSGNCLTTMHKSHLSPLFVYFTIHSNMPLILLHWPKQTGLVAWQERILRLVHSSWMIY